MEEELNPSNIYVIRKKLAILKRAPGQNHFEYYAGKFKVNIWLDKIQEHAANDDNDNILNHSVVHVDLHELSKKDDHLYDWVYLNTDSRFKNYEPIQYDWLPGLHQRYSNGENMPIHHLCELIKYLYKLPNLSAFI